MRVRTKGYRINLLSPDNELLDTWDIGQEFGDLMGIMSMSLMSSAIRDEIRKHNREIDRLSGEVDGERR